MNPMRHHSGAAKPRLRWQCCGKRCTTAGDVYTGIAVLVGFAFGTALFFWSFSRSGELALNSTECLGVPTVPLFFFIVAQICCGSLLFSDPGFVPQQTPLSRVCRFCGPPNVDKFDHHCGVLGVCIGGRNMILFVLTNALIGTTCTSGLYASLKCFMSIVSAVQLRQQATSVGNSRAMDVPFFDVLLHITLIVVEAYGAIVTWLFALLYTCYVLRGYDSAVARHSVGSVSSSCRNIGKLCWSLSRVRSASRALNECHEHDSLCNEA